MPRQAHLTAPSGRWPTRQPCDSSQQAVTGDQPRNIIPNSLSIFFLAWLKAPRKLGIGESMNANVVKRVTMTGPDFTRRAARAARGRVCPTESMLVHVEASKNGPYPKPGMRTQRCASRLVGGPWRRLGQDRQKSVVELWCTKPIAGFIYTADRKITAASPVSIGKSVTTRRRSNCEWSCCVMCPCCSVPGGSLTIEQRSVRMTAVTERMMCTSGFSTVAGRIMEDTRIETATTRLAAHKNER